MTKLDWDIGPRPYTYGLDRGVLYSNGDGYAWNGLVSLTEKVADAKTSVYLDGQKLQHNPGGEDFAVTLSAFTYPYEFENYDGFDGVLDAQHLPRFDLSYRMQYGDGYRIHIVYNALAIPSEKSWASLSEDVTPTMFAWDISTIPVEYQGIKPSAHVIVDTASTDPATLVLLENLLYGMDDAAPQLPTISELVDLFLENAVLIVTDHGDGSWTATGPDDMVYMIDATTFVISAPTAIYIASDTYKLSTG